METRVEDETAIEMVAQMRFTLALVDEVAEKEGASNE
jgi:hypothetical protein